MRDLPAGLEQQLQQCLGRSEEVSALLSDPEVISDQKQWQKLSREHAQLDPVVSAYQALCAYHEQCEDMVVMVEQETDDELKAMAQQELIELKAQWQATYDTLQVLLLPRDPNDSHHVYLEIRAGTGGDEAALFAGDLLRMYQRFCERQRWRLSVMSASAGDHGGFKEAICHIQGEDVYARLKFESGAHRVQRVPATESQGRVHTSACTVAVMPEVDAIEDFNINPADLRVDTYRSSGAGGQHVNTTDSAVRITHVPTGVVAECQDERSQHKNKAKAMQMLQSKLLAQAQAQQQQELASTRKSLVGSGDRSERIRTYNYPQGRVTDHRINLTLYQLDGVMEGGLEAVIVPLVQAHQADLLLDLERQA